MVNTLIFHNFNKEKEIDYDPFYNLNIQDYKLLLIYLSKNIKSNKYNITFDDGYKSIIPAIKFARSLGFETTAYIITSKINTKGFLSDLDISDLYSKGTKIGSHSHSHCNLTLLDDKRLDYELRKSKEILNKITNNNIDDISIPYGENNKKVIFFAKKYYLKIALSSPIYFNNNNNKFIGRLSIHRGNIKDKVFILSELKNKINLLFIFKIFCTKLLKKIIPLNLFRFLKSTIYNYKSINYF